MPTLVLEGGGMRGVYTAGVLEALSEASPRTRPLFDTVVACSAGACAAASYLAGQPHRNRRVYLDFLDGNKLVRFSRLLTGGSIMDIDYLAGPVTLTLCPSTSMRSGRARRGSRSASPTGRREKRVT